MTNRIANRKFAGLSAIVLALAVGATVPTSQALGQNKLVSANIPFDFQNGADHLQAGRYSIGMESGHILRLRGAKATSAALSRVEFNTSQPSAGGKLVFRRYGNRYFLREVWMGNETEHQVIGKSKAEKKQQLIGQNPIDRNGVEVALLEPFK